MADRGKALPLLALAGCVVFVTAGAWMVYVPAGLIALGVLLGLVFVDWAR